MPSDRRQINVRADHETAAEFDRLLRAVPAALGVPVSQATLIRLAVMELAKKYPGDPAKPKKEKK
jgi:hypothetical protein